MLRDTGLTAAGRVLLLGTSSWAFRFALEASITSHVLHGEIRRFLALPSKAQALAKCNAAKLRLQMPTISAGWCFLLRDAEAQSGVGRMGFSPYSLPDPNQRSRMPASSGGLLTSSRSLLEGWRGLCCFSRFLSRIG